MMNTTNHDFIVFPEVAKALEMGGSDEGPPGERMEGFYAGYFRDRDGNKLNAFCAG